MRRLALLAVVVTLDLAACKHKPQAHSDVVDTKQATALSELKMGDPAAEPQLIRGFYGVESGSWRWTAPKFAVKLKPPDGSAQTGATLQFQFSLPDVIVNKVGPVTLSASVNGMALPSQTYSKAGEYTYSAPFRPLLLAQAP